MIVQGNLEKAIIKDEQLDDEDLTPKTIATAITMTKT